MNELSTINVSTANLPATYERAKTALAECASLDECQGWADKAAALASYAKQAKDDQLERMSQRIRARAIRRAGELLKQIEPQNGTRTDLAPSMGAHTRSEAARAAGLSKHQMVQAVRVASVPQDVFDTCVDEEKPATVTDLAEMGKRSAPEPIIDLGGRDPHVFNRSMHFVGMIEDYERELAESNLDVLLPGLDATEAKRVRHLIARVDAIHDQIATRI